jgi:putative transposase
MPRQQRLNIPGTVFHIIARGIERRKIFINDSDRENFLSRLGHALKITSYECHAWSLMPNHFHLLIRSSQFSLGDLMRRLMAGYAGYFNRRHKRTGHLFQNRYRSILCQEDAYFLELVRYIHLNPARAGLVENLLQLDRYSWTGHSVLVGVQERPWQKTGKVLSHFSSSSTQPEQRYRAFISDGWGMGSRPDLVGGGLAGGWQGVLALRRAGEAWQGDARILGDGDFVSSVLKVAEETLVKSEQLKRAGWTLNSIIRRGCEITGIKPEDLYRKGRNNGVSRAKNLIAYWAVKELGIPGRALSKHLLISSQAISKCVEKGKRISETESIKLLN